MKKSKTMRCSRDEKEIKNAIIYCFAQGIQIYSSCHTARSMGSLSMRSSVEVYAQKTNAIKFHFIVVFFFVSQSMD